MATTLTAEKSVNSAAKGSIKIKPEKVITMLTFRALERLVCLAIKTTANADTIAERSARTIPIIALTAKPYLFKAVCAKKLILLFLGASTSKKVAKITAKSELNEVEKAVNVM
jgi:hypothetical protein